MYQSFNILHIGPHVQCIIRPTVTYMHTFKKTKANNCVYPQLEQKRQTSHTDEPRAIPHEFTVEEKGVHTSGYNSTTSEQYAAKVKSPNRHPSQTEKTQTNQEKIKVCTSQSDAWNSTVLIGTTHVL